MVRLCCRSFVGAGLALGLACAPLVSSAQTAPTTTHYQTTITVVYGSPYPITGHLDLQTFPSGIVRGYYWPAYQKQYIPVAGGRDGNYIWLDIGPSSSGLDLGSGPGGRYHVVGTVDADGSFQGQVYPETTAAYTGQAMRNAMAAAPAPTSNEQYTFSAKPVTDPPPGQ